MLTGGGTLQEITVEKELYEPHELSERSSRVTFTAKRRGIRGMPRSQFWRVERGLGKFGKIGGAGSTRSVSNVQPDSKLANTACVQAND